MLEGSSTAFLRRMLAVVLVGGLSLGTAAAVTVVTTTEAHAQAKKPDKKTRDAARKAYGAGEKAYGEGDYATAVERFKEADQQIPAPHAKYWIAKSLDKQDNVSEAIAAYEAFLADPDVAKAGDDKIDEAKNRIPELKGKLDGEVVITTTPAGATIAVDGSPQTGEPPLTVKLPPGKHKITVSATGFETREVEVDVAGGGRTEQSIELMPAAVPEPTAPAAPPPVAEPATAPAPPPEGKSKIPAYVTLGIAGVGAVVGTIFGMQALSAQSDFDEHPTVDSADDVERNALIADMAFGVAITLGVTGIVLLTSASDEPETPGKAPAPQRRARLNVAPVVSPTGGGATARWAF